ncbi:MAG: hypothetical protein FD133_1131 [Erysipelotrichaceae bacterium]|nr:MAG: hypothetical protein FD179_564 [Erysipelotrichaceae bacterium]TXT17999.1 MAG: hypothetical protein FD133_1131 [Erysipelotrichaceae bacterium]
MRILAGVYIEHKTIKLNTPFNHHYHETILRGTRVKVNFHNQACIAMVVEGQLFTQILEKPIKQNHLEDILKS